MDKNINTSIEDFTNNVLNIVVDDIKQRKERAIKAYEKQIAMINESATEVTLRYQVMYCYGMLAMLDTAFGIKELSKEFRRIEKLESKRIEELQKESK